MKVKSESEVAQWGRLLGTPWTAAYQAPPSMGFSRQEYWSGVPLPSPGTVLDSKDKTSRPGRSFNTTKIIKITTTITNSWLSGEAFEKSVKEFLQNWFADLGTLGLQWTSQIDNCSKSYIYCHTRWIMPLWGMFFWKLHFPFWTTGSFSQKSLECGQLLSSAFFSWDFRALQLPFPFSHKAS